MENKFSNVNAQTDVTNNTSIVSGSATTQAISDEVTASTVTHLHKPHYLQILIS